MDIQGSTSRLHEWNRSFLLIMKVRGALLLLCVKFTVFQADFAKRKIYAHFFGYALVCVTRNRHALEVGDR